MVLRRTLLCLLLLVLSVYISACGGEKFENYEAVSNEPVVQTTDFPMVVFIALPEGRGLCTGTFISSRAVLTAAHCTQEAGSYRVFASFGTFSTSNVVNLSRGEVNDPHDLSVLLLSTDVARWADGQVAYIGMPAVAHERVTLVGYGCANLKTRLGTGTKRKGDNYISDIGDYIELETPQVSSGAHGILGPLNRAGSCFGDSGGPLFRLRKGAPEVLGVSHSGGYRGAMVVSHYVNIRQNRNLDFIDTLANREGLDIAGACDAVERCTQSARAGIAEFLLFVWNMAIASLVKLF